MKPVTEYYEDDLELALWLVQLMNRYGNSAGRDIHNYRLELIQDTRLIGSIERAYDSGGPWLLNTENTNLHHDKETGRE